MTYPHFYKQTELTTKNPCLSDNEPLKAKVDARARFSVFVYFALHHLTEMSGVWDTLSLVLKFSRVLAGRSTLDLVCVFVNQVRSGINSDLQYYDSTVTY